MLVDDEPLVRQYIRMHFQAYQPDWEVAEEAMDGQEAWEKLELGRVDLVITDIKMPGLDGIELCKRIAQMANPPQILILTGFDEFGLAQEAIRCSVRNYLLKPIVKEELLTAVQEVTAWLDLKGRESLALFTQNSISKDSQIQVVKQFLKAVIEDSSVEIKTLYPLIYRLKVQLIETEGIIMVLELDEETMIRRGIPLGDYAVFRFILQQITGEISDEAGLGHVFLDEDQMTCALVTGENREHIIQRCRTLYQGVAEALMTNTGITVSAALGTFESEIFNLKTSYSNASHNLQARLWSGTPGLFVKDAYIAPADEWDVANRARAYICAHYGEPLSLAFLAEKLGVSPGYLSQTFHKTFQESYIKFLTRIRMEQAAKRLKARPPEKVYDVAEKVGYISVKHFSHVFKQHYQMPPGEYQELHASERRNN